MAELTSLAPDRLVPSKEKSTPDLVEKKFGTSLPLLLALTALYIAAWSIGKPIEKISYLAVSVKKRLPGGKPIVSR